VDGEVGSEVKGKSKIENRKSKIENRKSKIENRKSKIENRVAFDGGILRTWGAAVLRPYTELSYVVRRLGEIGWSCQAESW
jgi:hypothetical protein